MRAKYLKKLLELVKEMYTDRRDLDTQEKALLWTLRAILTAFWFYQIDELWQHTAAWKLRVSDMVSEDTFDIAEAFLITEAAEIAAVEAGASMVTEEEAAADRDQQI